MLKFTRLYSLRYDLPAWPGFYVLIVPNKDATSYSFYIAHEKHAILYEMFGIPNPCNNKSDKELIELAHYNAENYLPDLLKECLTEE